MGPRWTRSARRGQALRKCSRRGEERCQPALWRPRLGHPMRRMFKAILLIGHLGRATDRLATSEHSSSDTLGARTTRHQGYGRTNLSTSYSGVPNPGRSPAAYGLERLRHVAGRDRGADDHLWNLVPHDRRRWNAVDAGRPHQVGSGDRPVGE